MAKYNFNLIPILLVLAIQVKLDSYFIFLTNRHQTLKVTLHLSGPNQNYEKYFFFAQLLLQRNQQRKERGNLRKKLKRKARKVKINLVRQLTIKIKRQQLMKQLKKQQMKQPTKQVMNQTKPKVMLKRRNPQTGFR